MKVIHAAMIAGALTFVIAIVAIIFGPLAIIWALNTLFPVVAIPYSFWHWLAVVVLNLTWMYKPNFSRKTED